MEYEEIKCLKQSEKSTVYLVREKGGEKLFIRKILNGKHMPYQTLQDYQHPCLPKLYEVTVSEESTVVVEEYIEGQSCGAVDFSEKQFRKIVGELCSVLEFLHGNGIIHRDVKPSNIIFTEKGHVCLIDFDASRMPREGVEQDTKLLGTKGYAPPEQYGFSQTDERTDIYALGVTLDRLSEGKRWKSHYKSVIRKCMNLDPDKRYQSARKVRQAFFLTDRKVVGAAAVVLLLVLIGCCKAGLPALRNGNGTESTGGGAELTVLPAPENPRWEGETGNVIWKNVPESGVGDEVQFYLRLYKRDTADLPEPDDSDWYYDELVRFGGSASGREEIVWNIVPNLEENGFYSFTVAAVGDNVAYADSPFVVSDVFEYTGENAPPLPVPGGLEWKMYEIDDSRRYYATWSNLDDYEDSDFFNVTFYDQTGTYVMNNTWRKREIVEHGRGGIPIAAQFLSSGPGSAYRFTVQVYSSRPNTYRSSPMPDPAPEEYFSPWLQYGPKE